VPSPWLNATKAGEALAANDVLASGWTLAPPAAVSGTKAADEAA
jgi:hypothetical protein